MPTVCPLSLLKTGFACLLLAGCSGGGTASSIPLGSGAIRVWDAARDTVEWGKKTALEAQEATKKAKERFETAQQGIQMIGEGIKKVASGAGL